MQETVESNSIQMIIKHISDTHGSHDTLDLEDLSSVDVLVHTGDATNKRNPVFNEAEFFAFLEWYSTVDIDKKIYVSGNHDSWIFHNEKKARKLFKENGIIYLNKESVVIDSIKFYGDPTSPTFGDWCFQSKREEMYKHWELIPEDVNVLLTHTPPQGILDLAFDFNNNFKQVGCSNLRKVVGYLKKLKLHCYGHVHDHPRIRSNVGVFKMGGTKYSNAAAVVDGKFNWGCVNHGNLIEI